MNEGIKGALALLSLLLALTVQAAPDRLQALPWQELQAQPDRTCQPDSHCSAKGGVQFTLPGGSYL
ncbi:MAG: hypothetical protein KDI51_17465, partial [Xanthomonadales bacterium]|nr:hypothetical protein [Xanthomonadales bacterium]